MIGGTGLFHWPRSVENNQKDATKVAPRIVDSNWLRSSENQLKDVRNVMGVVVDSFIG